MGFKKQQIQVAFDPEAGTATFSGNTFPVKDTLRSRFGARWNGSCWTVKLEPEAVTLFPGQLTELFPTWRITTTGFPSEGITTEVKTELPGFAPGVQPPAGAFSVQELIGETERVLRGAFPKSLLVYGVISKFKADPKNDRLFIDLSPKNDPLTSVSCVIWNDVDVVLAPLTKLGFPLEENLDIMFEVSVGMNRRRGALSLTIIRIDETYMMGKLAALREQTNARLKAEGLFGCNQSLPFPAIPRKLLVLTSAAGTVIHDFLSSLATANFGFDILVRHVHVQGTNAKPQIVAAIHSCSELPELDLVLLFRGGGSMAELSVFSDYDVARAVALCPYPILTAIGHEEDQCSTQDVSFRAFGVPKDIGRFLADIILEHRLRLSETDERIRSCAETLIERLESKLQVWIYSLRNLSQEIATRIEHSLMDHFRSIPLYALGVCEKRLVTIASVEGAIRTSSTHLIAQSDTALGEKTSVLRQHLRRILGDFAGVIRLVSERVLHRVQQRVAALEDRTVALQQIFRRGLEIVDTKERQLAMLDALVQGSAPEVQLKRGFSLVRAGAKHEVVRSVRELRPKTEIEVHFYDGSVNAITEE